MTYVVVGGGLAGVKAVETLRGSGFTGPVTLIGSETALPYERPPLSKGMMLGTDAWDSSQVHPADWFSATRWAPSSPACTAATACGST